MSPSFPESGDSKTQRIVLAAAGCICLPNTAPLGPVRRIVESERLRPSSRLSLSVASTKVVHLLTPLPGVNLSLDVATSLKVGATLSNVKFSVLSPAFPALSATATETVYLPFSDAASKRLPKVKVSDFSSEVSVELRVAVYSQHYCPDFLTVISVSDRK